MQLVPRINSANAREFAAKSHEARRQNKLRREQEAMEAKLAALQQQQNPKPVATPESEDSKFILSRLVRVRKQLDRIDSMIEKEKDPMKLDRLASAQARLAEQERLLAGRPMPGSLKPKASSTKASLTLPQFDPEPIQPTIPPASDTQSAG